MEYLQLLKSVRHHSKYMQISSFCSPVLDVILACLFVFGRRLYVTAVPFHSLSLNKHEQCALIVPFSSVFLQHRIVTQIFSGCVYCTLCLCVSLWTLQDCPKETCKVCECACFNTKIFVWRNDAYAFWYHVQLTLLLSQFILWLHLSLGWVWIWSQAWLDNKELWTGFPCADKERLNITLTCFTSWSAEDCSESSSLCHYLMCHVEARDKEKGEVGVARVLWWWASVIC